MTKAALQGAKVAVENARTAKKQAEAQSAAIRARQDELERELKLVTVSRTFAKLEQRNIIRIVPDGVVLTGLEQTELVAGRSE